jgi:hypothetical protein
MIPTHGWVVGIPGEGNAVGTPPNFSGGFVNAYPDLFEDRYKICFIHLPKTGGKTFRQICRKQYRECNAYRLNNEDSLKQLHGMPKEDIAMIDLLHGHFPIGFLPPHMPRRFRYFVWLRDPLNRFLSTYNYWIHSKRDFGMPAARMVRENNMSLQDCIETTNYEIKYWMLPYVNMLEHAARSLIADFDFVGITERYTEGLEYLQRTYGFRTDYTIQNVTPPWAKRKTGATEEQKEQLRKQLAPEYVIYDFAKQIFEKRYNTMKERVYAGDGKHEIRYGRPTDLDEADIEQDYFTDRWDATVGG